MKGDTPEKMKGDTPAMQECPQIMQECPQIMSPYYQVGAPGRIRTCDHRPRKPSLYPLSYERKKNR